MGPIFWYRLEKGPPYLHTVLKGPAGLKATKKKTNTDEAPVFSRRAPCMTLVVYILQKTFGTDDAKLQPRFDDNLDENHDTHHADLDVPTTISTRIMHLSTCI